MKNFFSFSDNSSYNVKTSIHLSSLILHTTHCGTDCITNLEAKIWKVISQNIKKVNSRSKFKDTLREKATSNKTPTLSKKYEYRQLGSWCIKSTFHMSLLN